MFVGDSLLRHVTQALFMLLTEDLQYGALPRMSRMAGLHDTCRCDGQFSEDLRCRHYEHQNMFDVRDPRVYGVCSHMVDSSFSFGFALHYGGFQLPAHFDSLFCSADPRPRIVFANAGVHYQYNVDKVNATFLHPLVQHIQNATASCPHPIKWRLVIMSASAQSRMLDINYPNQRRENTLNYNGLIAPLLDSYHIDVLDVWNLTLNAATSDGFHYLSDVNLLIANTVVNLLDIIRGEITSG